MEPHRAYQIARDALDKGSGELEQQWLDQCEALVRMAAERGAVETEIRFLLPANVPSPEAMVLGRRLAARMEMRGFNRPRARLREEFLQEGPAVVGTEVYPEGTSLVWIELTLDWDR